MNPNGLSRVSRVSMASHNLIAKVTGNSHKVIVQFKVLIRKSVAYYWFNAPAI
jgi:hypothetical protein